MKQNKRLITMVSMLGALVVLFVGYKAAASMNDARERQQQAEEEAKNAAIMIAEYEYSDAVALSYQKKGEESIALELVNNRWMYSEDTTYPINQETAAYMANALASMGASAQVNTEGADVEAFGFDDPAWRFSITYEADSGERETHSYLMGNYNDFSDGYYFKEEGTDEVYLIVEGLTAYFEYDLHSIADTGSFAVLTADMIDSVEIAIGDGTVKSEGEDISESFEVLLNTLQPSAFLTHKTDDDTKAQYGLTKPAAKVTVNYTATISVADTEGSSSSTTLTQAKTFVMSIGDDVEVDGEIYTAYMVDGFNFIFYMPTSTVESMLAYYSYETVATE